VEEIGLGALLGSHADLARDGIHDEVQRFERNLADEGIVPAGVT
jgi:hypothetical protein